MLPRPGYSTGHNPRTTPGPNPRMSPVRSQGNNPRMSPGRNLQMGPESRPMMSPERSSWTSPGYSPRMSPGHSSRMSPGHSSRSSSVSSDGHRVRSSSVSPSRNIRRSSQSPLRGPPPITFVTRRTTPLGIPKIDFDLFAYDLALCALQNCEPRWRPENYWSYLTLADRRYYQPKIGWIANHEDTKKLMRITLKDMDFDAKHCSENPSLVPELISKMHGSQNKKLFPELLLSFFCEMMPMASLVSRIRICEELVRFLSDKAKRHKFWHSDGFLKFLSKIKDTEKMLSLDGRESFVPLSREEIEGGRELLELV